MMDDLERMLAAVRDGFEADGSASTREVMATVRRQARRRRTMHDALPMGLGVVIAAGIGAGLWAWGGQPHEPAEPAPSPSSTPTPSATPSPESTPSPEPSEPAQSADLGLDGIPADGYPPLAADRNLALSAEQADLVSYPSAHVLEEWVWEHVGPGWGVGVASMPGYALYEEAPLAPVVLYLWSPDDVYFEVAELPGDLQYDVRAVTWHEAERSVRLVSDGRGGLYDMVTGVWDPIEFSVGGRIQDREEFEAANAAGHELWSVRIDDRSVGYYRWDPASGWHRASLWDMSPRPVHFDTSPGIRWSFGDHDGERVILAQYNGDLPEALVLYELATDTAQVYPVTVPPDTNGLDWIGMTAAGEPVLDIFSSVGSLSTVAFDFASATLRPADRSDVDEDYGASDMQPWVHVAYGESTPRLLAQNECGC